MKPVWIRYYGVIPMTKRGYLVTLTMAGLLALAVVVCTAALGHLPPLRTMWDPDPKIDRLGLGGWLANRLWWILLLLLLAQALDTFVILRQFTRKEAEQRAQEEAGTLSGIQPPPDTRPVARSAVSREQGSPAAPSDEPPAVAPAENTQQKTP